MSKLKQERRISMKKTQYQEFRYSEGCGDKVKVFNGNVRKY